jgi:hypothetical protein
MARNNRRPRHQRYRVEAIFTGGGRVAESYASSHQAVARYVALACRMTPGLVDAWLYDRDGRLVASFLPRDPAPTLRLAA